MEYRPVGIIHTPFKEPKGTPVQPTAAEGVKGTVELDPGYIEGLTDLEGFSHIILLFHCHLTAEPSLKMKPFMDDTEHGIFAIRAPARPNPIGLSVVRLISVDGNILHIEDMDIIDGTPLLDIKPYVPEFDVRTDVRTGWLEKNVTKMNNITDDGRFV
jgi:tRNA-Thr(GGU) m(6)t(6)A37 methyltransferase TsaA